MKIIPTICPQCNAQIKIDADKKTGVCEYCGTHFILEGDKVIVQNGKEKPKKEKSGKSRLPLVLFGSVAVLSLGVLCFNHRGAGTDPSPEPVSNVAVAKTENSGTETKLSEESETKEQPDVVTETSETIDKKEEDVEYALADAVSAPGAVIGDPVADLEITKAGYSVVNGYLYYALAIHNNSDNKAVITPGYRYTAKVADGTILGTDEHYLFTIYPGQDCVWGFLAFQVPEMPATVEFDLIPPSEYNIMSADMMTHPEFKQYEIKNISEKSDPVLGSTIMGEVYNPNDYTVDQVAVSVVFLDADGVIQGGDITFVDHVGAKSSVPFSLNPTCPTTSDYQVFASSWSL